MEMAVADAPSAAIATRSSKSPHQFLQDENGAGDRRIERGGQACPRAGCKQHSAVGPAAPKFLADQMPNGRRHLDTRAFTAERQPRTDRQHPSRRTSPL